MRPDWSFVMVGPVVKISEDDLPQAAQHPLSWRQDVRRAAGLSVGLGRGADAVRDERIDAVHLADQDPGISRRRAARRVDAGHATSCAIMAICRREDRLAHADEFVAACEQALELARAARRLAGRGRSMLSATSWDTTQARMAGLIDEACSARQACRRQGPRWRGASTAPARVASKPLRLSDRRRRLCRLGSCRASGKPARRASPADRPAAACRRQRL